MESTIKILYNTFKPYTIVGNLRDRSCPCCITNQEIKDLLSTPLSQINSKSIRPLMQSGGTTFGDITDYKHFLPRLLELLTELDSDLLFDFTCFEKLNYLKWRTWPIQEQDIIVLFFKTLWVNTINNPNSTQYQIEGVLVILNTYNLIEFAFSTWEKYLNNNSILYLINEYLDYSHSILMTDVYDKFIFWLSSETILKKIEEAFFSESETITANRISIAYTLLENFKQNSTT